MRNLLFLFATILTMFGFINCTGKSSSQSKNDILDTVAVSSEKLVEEESDTDPWSYSEDTDKMTDTKTYFAANTSPDHLSFDFPYNEGANVETLILRKRRNSTDVIIQITQGQFQSGIYGGAVLTRFDDDKPQKYSYSTSSDGTSTVIFINQVEKFINRLKTSKKLLIEAEFYQEGNVQVSYDTEGLKWEH